MSKQKKASELEVGPKEHSPAPPKEEGMKFSKFFTYITPTEKYLLIFGIIGAVVAGAMYPALAIVIGSLTNAFDPSVDPTTSTVDQMRILVIIIVCIGVGAWVFAYMFFAFFQHLAENISFDLRKRFLHHLLLQEIGYFEEQHVESMPTLIGEYFSTISGAIGEKFSNIINTIATFVVGVIVALVEGPVYACICLAFFPVLFLTLACFGKSLKKSAVAKIEQSRQMGGVVEENLSAIKLIVSFAQEKKACDTFSKVAAKTRDVTHHSEKLISLLSGTVRFQIYWFYAYSYWMGAILIYHGRLNERSHALYNVGTILTVQISIMMGLMTLMSLNPNIQAFQKALVVGRKVFDVIDRVPLIRDMENSKSEFSLHRVIKFENVTFKYPTALPNVRNVLQNSSFHIKVGSSTAIVGPSGSGKSTIVQMIERFYNTTGGDIYFDETNIKDIQLKTLRESIGYVSQEPVLILGTIRDNMLFGNKDATDAEIQDALYKANATFVYEMEGKLDTYIGSASVLNMSGGQKQRIAIARALVKRPKILILDEATSALDPRSEKEVQDAINSIAALDTDLTIIMIAHRLQTIQTAKNLIYIESNTHQIVAEKGTPAYDDIMERLQQANYAHQQEEEANKLVEKSKGKGESSKDVAGINKKEYHSQDTERDLEDDGMGNLVPSFSAAELKKKQEMAAAKKQETRVVGMMEIMKYYEPKYIVAFSFLVCVISGFGYPVHGYVFSELIFELMYPKDPKYWYWINFWNGMFLVLGFGIGFTQFLQRYNFSALGEQLTFTMRNKLFQGIIYKHVAWFDSKDKATGVLSNALSEDITLLNGLSTETISIALESIFTLIIGIVISFYFSWRMALITIALIPLVVAGGLISVKLTAAARGATSGVATKNVGQGQTDHYKESNALLSDLIMNYRTVISFGPKNIEFLMTKYNNLLLQPKIHGAKMAHSAGIGFGYSFFIRFAFIGVVFYIAAVIIQNYNLPAVDNYLAVFVLFMSALGAGMNASNMPSISKARTAANQIFEIIDEPSKIDVREAGGIMKIEAGAIEFNKVNFIYPSRTKRVLKEFNMSIPANKKIALVGYSGCGKSTIANLLLRFYELNEGHLLIDGRDITEYNVAELRRQIGIVMQEPILFNVSIKENILYGNENASDQRVWQVADMANALQFIESNIEDLDNENVQSEINKKFQEKVMDYTIKYPNMRKLTEQGNAGNISIKEKDVIYDILRKSDTKLRDNINAEIQRFIDQVHQDLQIAGAKWDDIALNFEWSFQKEQIIDLMNKTSILSQQDKQDIAFCIQKQPTKWDVQTLREYIARLEQRQNWDNKGFISFVGDAYLRMKDYNTQRLKDMDNAQFIENDKEFKLHEGFNKKCGIKGSLLSGGQKQRIAIARALIKDPKILILDEATSALDEKSQEIVQQALDRAMEGRTSVVIAHRLSTIRNCEWMFVIHKGKVVEEGTYDQLSADHNSYFYKLKSGMEM